jgi:hypothetical protein
MGTQLDIDRGGFPPGVTYPALELAKHGHITAVGWERIELVKGVDDVVARVGLRR